ncbi:MAG: aldose epimerase [Verrucomicrobiota bacterium]
MEILDIDGHPVRKWQRGASTFIAYPEAGARLMNWHLALADGSYRDVIHWPEDADLGNIAKVRGGNPVLFPFAARTFDQGQLGYWRGPDGARRPMQQHGYCRQGKFEVTSAHEHGFTADFLPDEACKEAYPFDYTFSVRYRFEQLAFYVDFSLQNHGQERIPWSAGHHFYFSLPWHEGSSREDYELYAPAKKAFHQDGEGKLVPVKPFPERGSFDDPALVDLIRCKLKSHEVRFGPKSGEEDVIIRIGDSRVPSEWTTLVSWTMAEDSPFYCVEPWMGPPNSPETKKGLHWVEPGQTEVFSVEVSLA